MAGPLEIQRVNCIANGVRGVICLNSDKIQFIPTNPNGVGFNCSLPELSGIFLNDTNKNKGRAFIKILKHSGEDFVIELLPTENIEPSELQKLVVEIIRNNLQSRVKPNSSSVCISNSNSTSTTPTTNSVTSVDTSLNNTHTLSNTSSSFYLTVTVSDPQRFNDYVAYRVTTRTNLPQFKCSEVVTYHRYKEFEKLHTILTTQFPTLHLPPFPAKSYMSRFNPSFLEMRCKELHQYLSQLVQYPQLQTHPQLLQFLQEGQLSEGNDTKHQPSGSHITTSTSTSSSNSVFHILTLPLSLIVDSNIAVAVEQRIHQLTSSSSSSEPSAHFVSVEEDYLRVRQLMKRWDLVPEKLPFEKFVVLVLGSTSAGKSALINHLVKVPCKKSTSGQLDTMYTIVEVVNEDVFQRYTKRKPTSTRLTRQELMAPVNDINSDPRRGIVFQYLSTPETITRYQDQLGYITQEREYRSLELFQAVLINGACLDLYFSQDPDVTLAKKSIFIDSPGFDSGELNGLADRFLGNLKILQCLYTLSDITLFLLPATQLNMISNQIALLELSVLYANFGLSRLEELIPSLYKKEPHPQKKSFLPSLADLKQLITNSFHSRHEEVTYRGTAYWNKTLFLISQIDLAFRSTRRNDSKLISGTLLNEPRESDFNDTREQYYELGRLFGKSLTYLDPPVFDQCLTIGLPEHQTNCTEIYTGDLKKLKCILRERNAQAPLEHRLEVAIQQMCLTLQEKITQSWSSWAPTQWFSSDLTVVKELLNRSHTRMKGTLKTSSSLPTTSLQSNVQVRNQNKRISSTEAENR